MLQNIFGVKSAQMIISRQISTVTEWGTSEEYLNRTLRTLRHATKIP